MASAELELQGAIVTQLKADAALTALVNGVYDQPPGTAWATPKEGYVTIGEAQFIRDDATCISGGDVYLTLHAWSRKAGFPECKKIADAVVESLHLAPMNLTTCGSFPSCIARRECFAISDGLTSHGVIDFVANVERIAADAAHHHQNHHNRRPAAAGEGDHMADGQQLGRLLLIKVGDGGSPETFNNLCGIKLSFNLSANEIDTTIPSCTNRVPGSENQPPRHFEPYLHRLRQFREERRFDRVPAHVRASEAFNAQVVVPGDGTYEGSWMVTDFSFDGDVEPNLEFSATFVAADVLTLTAEV